MTEQSKSQNELKSFAADNLERAQKGFENYLRFWRDNVPASSFPGSEVTRKMTGYTQQNITNAFDCAQKLLRTTDVGEFVRVQNDFFQSQMRAFAEQAKDLGDTFTKSTVKGMNTVGGQEAGSPVRSKASNP